MNFSCPPSLQDGVTGTANERLAASAVLLWDAEVHVAWVESSQLRNVRHVTVPVRRPKPSRRILGACCPRMGRSPEDSRGTGILQCCTLRALEVSGRWSFHGAREHESKNLPDPMKVFAAPGVLCSRTRATSSQTEIRHHCEATGFV